MNSNCIFCKIISGDIPASKVYESDQWVAFFDISPIAPVHVVLIPKTHYDTILDVDDPNIMPGLIEAVRVITADLKIDESGFRTVVNTRNDGGQTVKHLHFHILGGRILSWPPG